MRLAESATTHDQFEVAQWIQLVLTRGVGSETGRRLLARFGLPQHIFSASSSALAEVAGSKIARSLLTPPPSDIAACIARTLLWLKQPDHHLLTLADTDYPPQLLNIPDPPLLLYAKGKRALLRQAGIAVVGSRNASAQGRINAEKFADSLSANGLTVISGMALGIDAAAHTGALPHPASTIAVIGTGIDIVYPARNHALAHHIADKGCLLSEYALGTPAIASNFPRRNRLISGLSRAVLVIEAAAQSGSLITARMAAEQGRDVFAIPGSIHSPLAKGCHQLIRQGAKLVESTQDILDELGLAAHTEPRAVKRAETPQLSEGAAELLNTLGFDPVDMDTLSARSGLTAAALSVQLLALELHGLLEMLPGGQVRRMG